MNVNAPINQSVAPERDACSPGRLAFGEGLAHYQAGAYAEAAASFAAAREDAPDDPNALRLYGLALARAGEPSAGLPFLKKARRLAWRDPLAHLHCGIGLTEAGQPARAAAVLRRAAMLAPEDPAVWINFSTALLALDRPAAARAAARRAVKHAPDMTAAFCALGLAHLACDDAGMARLAFRRATELQPGFATAWLNLGLAAYRQYDIVEATRAMRQALAADPGDSAAEANLAAFQLLAGDSEEAIARLRAALDRDPASIPVRLNLVNALLLEESAAEALGLLDSRAPDGREGRHWRAHRALALIHLGRWEEARAELDAIPEPYGDAEILVLWRRIGLASRDGDEAAAASLATRMEAALETESAGLPEHRIIGHYDLARFHHQRGHIAKAFDHWTRGHKLLARAQPFSRAKLRDMTDASISAFDAARLARAEARNGDSAPLFIIGMPRSGTTLTEQILNAHPQVFGAGERPAMHRLISRLAGDPDSAAAARELAALSEETLSKEGEAYLADLHALAPEARYVVDKMPANARHLGFIACLLPGARFIHCRRDPRDIGLSIFQLRFFGYHPYAHDLGDLGFAIAEHERLMAHWRKILGGRLIEVELTDWTDDFSATLARTLEFIDLPHDPACERFHEQTRKVRTASAQQVRNPINRRGVGRYRPYAEFLGPLFEELDCAGLIRPEGETQT